MKKSKIFAPVVAVAAALSLAACTLEEFYTSTQLFGFLPVGMMTGSRRVAVYYKP